MNLAVLGASDKPDRYSHKACLLLREKGHRVFPVHPTLSAIEGMPVYPALSAVPERIDILTMYVSAENSAGLTGEILKKPPRAIVFNPGAENPSLAAAAEKAGIRTLEACTLVLLRTGQFDRVLSGA